MGEPVKVHRVSITVETCKGKDHFTIFIFPDELRVSHWSVGEVVDDFDRERLKARVREIVGAASFVKGEISDGLVLGVWKDPEDFVKSVGRTLLLVEDRWRRLGLKQ